MATIGAAFYSLKAELVSLYDEQEAAAIAHELLGHITGLSKLERLSVRDSELSEPMLQQYMAAVPKLKSGVPLQYVTNEAWFMGMPFYVNGSVLIPRPETEELVDWIIRDHQRDATQYAIIDIGTGSGCIPVSLGKRIYSADITACDISREALAVAARNAAALEATVSLVEADFLDREGWSQFGLFDIIVSNPPYIAQSERENLHANVREHEPGLALFVPDNDPLIFYRAIAEFAKTHLAAGGAVYCELDADHANETYDLFKQDGYAIVELRADMHGNQRMLKASYK